MSQAPQQHPKWQVRRTFETNRLSQGYLNAAYEQVVPIHIRIVSRHRWDWMMQFTHRKEQAGREGRAA